jgi:hypothetical protein
MLKKRETKLHTMRKSRAPGMKNDLDDIGFLKGVK